MRSMNDIYNLSCIPAKKVKDFLRQLDGEELERAVLYLKNSDRKNIRELALRYERDLNRQKKIQKRNLDFMNFDAAYRKDKRYIAGVDEVGRGPLAGPIVAAAVVISSQVEIRGINDSKKINSTQRKQLVSEIVNKVDCWSVSFVDNEFIDIYGIQKANEKAMQEAVCGLKIKPDLILADGYIIPGYEEKSIKIIKGDQKSQVIACAANIAKFIRDSYMEFISDFYPEYEFSSNAGYGTEKHINAIINNGISPLHRKSFLKNILA